VISVLTPTIASRAHLLPRCKESVASLTVPYEHIVVLDDPPSGGASAPVAKAQRMAQYDWRVIVPDDDYLVPGGVEQLLNVALEQELDFVLGSQGHSLPGGTIIYGWENTWPEPGATGAFIWHRRLNDIAELPKESCFPNRTDERGNDYLLLQRWVEGGAKFANTDIRLIVHCVDP
jgi:hypothetical protein